MDPLTFLVLYCAYFMLDVLHANYIKNVVGHHPVKAASFGSGTYVISAIGVMSYTHNVLYLIPIVLGSWCGIYFVVRRGVAKTS